VDEKTTAPEPRVDNGILETLARTRSARRAPDGPCPSRERLGALRANTLDPVEATRVVRHLADCPVCRDRLVCLDTEVPSLSRKAQRRLLRLLVPRRPRWRSWAVGTGGAVAAAAAVFLLVLVPSSPVPEDLPDYTLSIDGYVRATRGTARPDQVPVYLPESDLVFLVRPVQGEASAQPRVVVYLEAPDGSFEPLAIAPEVSSDDTGLIAVRVRAGAVLGRDFGLHRLRLLLLPPAVTPPERLEDGQWDENGQVLEVEIAYRAELEPEGAVTTDN